MPTTRREFLRAGVAAVAALAISTEVARRGAPPLLAQAMGGVQSFSGNATTTALGPVSLNAGLVVVRVQFNGTTNFSSALIQPEPGQGPTGLPVTDGYFALFNQLGAFKGAAASLIIVPGSYYLQVGSTGAFQLSIEQPLPATVTPVQQTSFSGKGVNVSPYFTLPSTVAQVAMQSSNQQLVATLYHLDDLGGSPIVAGVQGADGELFDFRDSANQPSFPLSLPDSGPYLLAVANDVDDQASWRVSFS